MTALDWTPGPMQLRLSEAAWQRQVIDLARLHRWEVHHSADSRRAHAGWPDLVLAGHRRVLFAELKTERGRLRPEQTRWLELLAAAGLEVALWRPRDLPAVIRTLGPVQQRLTGPPVPTTTVKVYL